MYWISYLTRSKTNAELWGKCKPTYFAYYFSEHYAAWIISLMTIERCLSILLPLQSKQICTVRNASIVCFILALVFLVYDAHYFITITRSGNSCSYINGVSQVYLKHFDSIDAAMYSYIPFAVMMGANIAIILKMMLAGKKSNKVRVVGQVHAPQGTALSKNAKRTTFMLLSVSMLYCVTTMPVSVYYAITKDYTQLTITSALLKNLGYFNHGINFLLYCLTGSKFRSEFVKRVSCRCVKKGSVNPVTSNVSTVDTIP